MWRSESASSTRCTSPTPLPCPRTLCASALPWDTSPNPASSSVPAPKWSLLRSVGPAGLICASAADLVEFARIHLHGGRGPHGDGNSPRRPCRRDGGGSTPRCPTRGLWAITADSVGFSTTGTAPTRCTATTAGRSASTPSCGSTPTTVLAVALLTNGGDATAAYTEVFGRLFADLCGSGCAPSLRPKNTPTLDGAAHVGTYERHGARLITITTPTTDGLACRSEQRTSWPASIRQSSMGGGGGGGGGGGAPHSPKPIERSKAPSTIESRRPPSRPEKMTRP